MEVCKNVSLLSGPWQVATDRVKRQVEMCIVHSPGAIVCVHQPGRPHCVANHFI